MCNLRGADFPNDFSSDDNGLPFVLDEDLSILSAWRGRAKLPTRPTGHGTASDEAIEAEGD
jgi:hypothetical protein